MMKCKKCPSHASMSASKCTGITANNFLLGKRLMTTNIQKIKFFRRHIPTFVCKPGCHDCCGPVTTSPEEMSWLPVKTTKEHDTALENLSCPHLGKEGCQVYDDRPLICRLFGTTPSLACPNGYQPEVMIAPGIEKKLHEFFSATRQVLV